MEKIKKVSFNDGSVLNGEQLNQTVIKRLPPSGSGSGVGSSSNSWVDSGSGEISSSHGGSWSANCSVGWEASYNFVEKEFSKILTSVRIQTGNVYISCRGIYSGKNANGVCYVPNQCGFIVTSCSYSDSSSSGVSTTMHFSTTLSKQSFGVVKETYDSKGNIVSSELLSEEKNITLGFEFTFNESTHKIEFVSCKISASESY